MRAPAPTTVRVVPGRSGEWDVAVSDRDERLTCETLREARDLARRYAAHSQPCELIVHDAYHRVLCHEQTRSVAA